MTCGRRSRDEEKKIVDIVWSFSPFESISQPIVDWSKPPMYDEYPEDVGEFVESIKVSGCILTQVLLPNSSMILIKQKYENRDWIEEAVLEQRTKVFDVYGAVNGLECVFLMDSGSQTNCVFDFLVSYLHIPNEYLDILIMCDG